MHFNHNYRRYIITTKARRLKCSISTRHVTISKNKRDRIIRLGETNICQLVPGKIYI